jgi:hypothetical protein
LDWQHHQRQLRQPGGFDTYREFLAQQGATPATITEAEQAVGLPRRYLNSGD